MNTAGRLLSRYVQGLKPGRLDWIGLRPERKVDMLMVTQVEAIAEMGLAGGSHIKQSTGFIGRPAWSVYHSHESRI